MKKDFTLFIMASIDDFFKALGNDTGLREKVGNAPSAAEAVKVAAAAGFSITEQELIDAYKSRMSEMTVEQLSSVAGGKAGGDTNKNSTCCGWGAGGKKKG